MTNRTRPWLVRTAIMITALAWPSCQSGLVAINVPGPPPATDGTTAATGGAWLCRLIKDEIDRGSTAAAYPGLTATLDGSSLLHIRYHTRI